MAAFLMEGGLEDEIKEMKGKEENKQKEETKDERDIEEEMIQAAEEEKVRGDENFEGEMVIQKTILKN